MENRRCLPGTLATISWTAGSSALLTVTELASAFRKSNALSP
jgi:hypothetical protein